MRSQFATITLSRPDQLNTWNTTMMRELGHGMLSWDRDDEIRPVVVKGI